MRLHRPPTLILLLAAAAVSVLGAGCGGGGASGVASEHSSTTADTTTQNGALAFARCMRAHGVAGWPDPNRSGVFDKSKLQQLGVTPSRVRAIEDGACDHLLPDGGGQQSAKQKRARFAGALAFARC